LKEEVMIRFAALILVSFVVMEFVSYLAHRYVYHKLLWVFHRSHHSPRTGPFEANDVFPAFFATLAIAIMVTALSDPLSPDLLAVSIGVSLYGIVYFFVHDLYVHRRVRRLGLRIPFLIEVKKAHALHHRYGGEPYGLLFFAQRDRVRREVVAEGEDV
jgi:beta-carotene 3-hydroxylase